MFMHLKLRHVILNLLLNMLFVILVNLLWLNLVFLTMMVNMLHSGMIDMKIIKELKKPFMPMILLKDSLFIFMINISMYVALCSRRLEFPNEMRKSQRQYGLNLIFSVLKTFLSSSVKYFLFTYILCFITAISYFTMYLLVAIRTY